MSSGARGAVFERAVCAALAEFGVWYPVRSAGSHGPVDVVAVSEDEVLFVQCRLGGPRLLGPAEWNELYALAMRYGATPLLAHRPRRGRIEFLRILQEKSRGRGVAPPCEPWEVAPVELEAS